MTPRGKVKNASKISQTLALVCVVAAVKINVNKYALTPGWPYNRPCLGDHRILLHFLRCITHVNC